MKGWVHSSRKLHSWLIEDGLPT